MPCTANGAGATAPTSAAAEFATEPGVEAWLLTDVAEAAQTVNSKVAANAFNRVYMFFPRTSNLGDDAQLRVSKMVQADHHASRQRMRAQQAEHKAPLVGENPFTAICLSLLMK
ncbi:hypothetical protein [Dyella amyloliquefaciens]|uniref:hypothetical protein n=1 Tax=Dyella amyloliquefaciens TaxID=1770545 RepID=UPI0013EE9F62|nr:hypothetical protein [Dyella amyloliquefaciens]